MARLSEASERVLSGLIELWDQGKRPTFAEIAAHIGRTFGAVQAQIGKLQQAGYVTRDEGARGLRPLKHPDGRPYGDAPLPTLAGALSPTQRDTLNAAMRATETEGGPVTAAQVARQLGGLDPRATAKRLEALNFLDYVAFDGQRYAVTRHANGRPFHVTRERSAATPSPREAIRESLERVLELLDAPAELAEIPLLGSIDAGPGTEAVPLVGEVVSLPSIAVRGAPGSLYALRVAGRSMEPGIKVGDVAILRHVEAVESGTVAAVLLPDGNATLKRVFLAGDVPELRPDNAEFAPIELREGVTVQGALVGIWRQVE